MENINSNMKINSIISNLNNYIEYSTPNNLSDDLKELSETIDKFSSRVFIDNLNEDQKINVLQFINNINSYESRFQILSKSDTKYLNNSDYISNKTKVLDCFKNLKNELTQAYEMILASEKMKNNLLANTSISNLNSANLVDINQISLDDLSVLQFNLNNSIDDFGNKLAEEFQNKFKFAPNIKNEFKKNKENLELNYEELRDRLDYIEQKLEIISPRNKAPDNSQKLSKLKSQADNLEYSLRNCKTFFLDQL